MKNSSFEYTKQLEVKLKLIDKLLQERKYTEALAEIRDFESTQIIHQLNPEELLQFYYLKAVALRFLGNYNEALDNGNMAFSLVKVTNDNHRIAQIQYVLGLIHISLGDLRNAEIEIRDALTGFRRVGDYGGTIDTLSRLAQIGFLKSNYSKAVDYTLEALEYCKKMGDERRTAILHGNLGVRYTLIGKWREAEENLRLNVKINEENKDEINLARGLLSLGFVLSLRREFIVATNYYEEALKIIFKTNCMREFAIYHEYAGELAFFQIDYTSAKQHYLKAIEIGEKVAPEGDVVSQSYRLLAELQIAQKQYNEAISSCEKALKVAESLGERIEIGAIHRALGQIYTAKKDKGKAQENFEKSISILEEIGAKFELGKAYLEALKSDSFEYHDRVAYFANAREVFKELESDYWLGKTTLAFCEMLFETGEYEKAEVYLEESENIFNRLNEEKELIFVLELKNKINKVLDKIGTRETINRIEYHFSDIVTKDPQMLALLEEARKLKDLDVPILIEGETGTGKDLLASAIHCESRRKNKRFVPVNCPAIPEHLLESELFGFKKGAFTGADKEKMGLFEAADGGTVFLNEIGDLPLRLQAKILDVIENKRLTRLGEVQAREFDFRVIAATNKDLSDEVVRGNFREDLYHRLNVLKLKLPPLRQRKNDIPLLIKHFLAKQGISCEDLDKSIYLPDCLGCHWPGNVRQLKNELKRLVSISNPFDLQKLLEELSKLNQTRDEVVAGNSLVGKKAEAEKAEILEVIKNCDGDKEMAAKFLGVSRSTLYRKIKDYNLDI